MVGLLALPLALGFGVIAGMGATAGLVTTIVASHGSDGVAVVVGLVAGVILVCLAAVGAGRFIR